jgi:hypothetical protein
MEMMEKQVNQEKVDCTEIRRLEASFIIVFLFQTNLNKAEHVIIHEFRNEYIRMEASNRRGPSGSIPKDSNSENRVMPTKSSKNYKDNLRNYLRIVNDVSKEFKNSELMKRRFYEKIGRGRIRIN